MTLFATALLLVAAALLVRPGVDWQASLRVPPFDLLAAPLALAALFAVCLAMAWAAMGGAFGFARSWARTRGAAIDDLLAHPADGLREEVLAIFILAPLAAAATIGRSTGEAEATVALLCAALLAFAAAHALRPLSTGMLAQMIREGIGDLPRLPWRAPAPPAGAPQDGGSPGQTSAATPATASAGTTRAGATIEARPADTWEEGWISADLAARGDAG